MTADEYEATFHGIDLPESLELFPGVIIADVKDFVSKELYILRTSSSVRVIETVKYRLDQTLKLLEK